VGHFLAGGNAALRISKFISSVALAVLLMVSPAQAYQPTDDDVYTAWALMFSVYSSFFGSLVWDGGRPIEFVPIENEAGYYYLGMYGDGCEIPKDLNFIEAWIAYIQGYYGCYFDPEYQKTLTIKIDLDDIEIIAAREKLDPRLYTIFVIAHELGHHALILKGIPIEDHHPLMTEYLDGLVADRLKLKTY
jgi:hypothetical protein